MGPAIFVLALAAALACCSMDELVSPERRPTMVDSLVRLQATIWERERQIVEELGVSAGDFVRACLQRLALDDRRADDFILRVWRAMMPGEETPLLSAAEKTQVLVRASERSVACASEHLLPSMDAIFQLSPTEPFEERVTPLWRLLLTEEPHPDVLEGALYALARHIRGALQSAGAEDQLERLTRANALFRPFFAIVHALSPMQDVVRLASIVAGAADILMRHEVVLPLIVAPEMGNCLDQLMATLGAFCPQAVYNKAMGVLLMEMAMPVVAPQDMAKEELQAFAGYRLQWVVDELARRAFVPTRLVEHMLQEGDEDLMRLLLDRIGTEDLRTLSFVTGVRQRLIQYVIRDREEGREAVCHPPLVLVRDGWEDESTLPVNPDALLPSEERAEDPVELQLEQLLPVLEVQAEAAQDHGLAPETVATMIKTGFRRLGAARISRVPREDWGLLLIAWAQLHSVERSNVRRMLRVLKAVEAPLAAAKSLLKADSPATTWVAMGVAAALAPLLLPSLCALGLQLPHRAPE